VNTSTARALCAVATAAVMLAAGCGDESSTSDVPPPPPPPRGGSVAEGKAIFTRNCAGCHTLADAGTDGVVGPNLDQTKPPKALVIERVTKGMGAMPSFRDRFAGGPFLTSAQVQAVADYVSSAAG
jgi:mono/diheme cytochrome c family protein